MVCIGIVRNVIRVVEAINRRASFLFFRLLVLEYSTQYVETRATAECEWQDGAGSSLDTAYACLCPRCEGMRVFVSKCAKKRQRGREVNTWLNEARAESCWCNCARNLKSSNLYSSLFGKSSHYMSIGLQTAVALSWA